MEKVIISVMFLLGICFLLFGSVLLLIIPTAFNILLTLIITQRTLTKVTRNKYILCFSSVIISMLIGLNVRIPQIITTFNSNKNYFYTSGIHVLNNSESIDLFSNTKKYAYATYPFKANKLELYPIPPFVETNDRTNIQHIDFEKYILDKPISLNVSTEAEYKVRVIKTENNKYSSTIDIEIFNKFDDKIAYSHTNYVNFISTNFSSYEDTFYYLSNKARFPSLADFIAHLFQYNVWDLVVNSLHSYSYQPIVFVKLFESTFDIKAIKQ